MSPAPRRPRRLISARILRDIARLERKLERTDDPDSQDAIMEEIEDAQAELRDYEAWRAQGAERGWLGGGA